MWKGVWCRRGEGYRVVRGVEGEGHIGNEVQEGWGVEG